MERQAVFQSLKNAGIVPVIRSSSSKKVLQIVEALMKGGIAVAEVTMTVPRAIETIEQCANEFGTHLTLGAGTVMDDAVCTRAIDAGSQFVVTPTVRIEVVKKCKEKDICVIGGALTPSEILAVWEAGADAVKVFPVKALGGAAYLRMLIEPMPSIPLVPTGGVTLETLEEYFRAGAVFVGAGGDLVNKKEAEAGNFAWIAERSRQYVTAIRKARPSPHS
jgi:2-dehydro-3-deoxyphosphogluconate aldolase / (4S)-4-hydroxy-2-oxoglutarate aldolase